MKQREKSKRLIAAIAVGIVLVMIAAALLCFSNSRNKPQSLPRAESPSGVQPPPVAPAEAPPQSVSATNGEPVPQSGDGVLPNYSDFQERPLPVGYQSERYEWTLEDGKDTNCIRRLAHNPLEYERLVSENARIFKRQLIYLKETPAMVFEQAQADGKTVSQLTLPGMGGQELAFQINKSEGKVSSRQGRFFGTLVGNPDSLVTLAFRDGRQAYTVISPADNLYLIGDPREDGQVILKAIDPNTYGLGPAQADCTVPSPHTHVK